MSLPSRLSILLVAALTLAACEDAVHAVRESPVLRDIAEDGELTVWREEF